MPKAKNHVRLWGYLKKYRYSLFFALFFKILGAVMNALEPLILGFVITEITANVLAIANAVKGAGINYSYVTMMLVLYVVCGGFYSLSSWLSNVYMTKAVQATIRDLRDALSQKINKIPTSYFDNHQFGDMLGRFTSDIETVSNTMQQAFLQIVNAIFMIIFAVSMAVYINAGLSLIVIISIPLTYFSARFILSKSQPYFKRQATILGDMNGFVQENLTGFNVLKLYAREEQSQLAFSQIMDDLQETGFKASFISGIMMPVLSSITDVAYLIIALFGGLQVLSGQLTIGNLQALIQYIWQVNQPVQTITQLAGQLQAAQSSLERIFTVLDEKEELSQVTESLTEPLTGQVSFEKVTFHYHENQPLIRDFNLDVQPGEMIAIVGPTGAGKTTLINLLMRFYDVTSGRITVDGHDIRNLSRQDFRSHFGMVLQDAWLYEGTIKDNLRFGNLDASDEEVVAAAQAANVDHFIRTLPGAYNMVINQESSNISLGQKQLLTIARALLSNPKILILDEATSSVDTRLELLIQKAMKRLMEGRTSFVIAHHLSTIQEADNILVLKDGQIIEQGKHESLLKAKGFYYELYQSQFSK